MPIFICAKCGCIDNTATSSYWTLRLGTNRDNLKYHKSLADYIGKPLCSECGRYVCGKDKDGNSVEAIVPGRWHGKFDKAKATPEQIKRADSVTGIIKY